MSDIATVPTVGDTLAALDDLCNDLSEVLKQISDISAELSNKEHIGLDSAEEVGSYRCLDGADH